MIFSLFLFSILTLSAGWAFKSANKSLKIKT